MANVKLSSDISWLTTRAITREEASAATDEGEGSRGFGKPRESGQWGEILDRERIYRSLEVVGLAGAAGASASADFSFTVKGEAGLKVTILIANAGATATYAFEQGLTLECEEGAAKVASLLIPFDKVTQQFKPNNANEWFPNIRFEHVGFDPTAPNIGARADAVPIEQVLEWRKLPPVPIGSGTAAFKQKLTLTAGLSISAELGPKFMSGTGDDATEVGSLSLTVSVSGEVSVTLEYELQANLAFQHHWLSPLAGGCLIASPQA